MTATLEETFAAAKAAQETHSADRKTIDDAYTTLNQAQIEDEMRVRKNRTNLDRAHGLLYAAADQRFKQAIANVAGVDPAVVPNERPSYEAEEPW